jgi:hypothetical protein
VRAQLLGERVFVLAAGDGDGAVAGFGGVLDGEVAEAADAEDGDGVSGAGSRVAERVEGGDAGAEQRSGVGVGEAFGHEGEGVGGGDDVVRVTAVVADAGEGLVFAEDEVAAAAGRALVAVASVPAETDALAGLEERDVGADDAGDFEAGRAWILDAGPLAFPGQRVAVTHTAGMHADAYVAGAGLGEFLFDELKRTAGGGDLHGTTFDSWHVQFSSAGLDGVVL